MVVVWGEGMARAAATLAKLDERRYRVSLFRVTRGTTPAMKKKKRPALWPGRSSFF